MARREAPSAGGAIRQAPPAAASLAGSALRSPRRSALNRRGVPRAYPPQFVRISLECFVFGKSPTVRPETMAR
jgi:hypothetical protein